MLVKFKRLSEHSHREKIMGYCPYRESNLGIPAVVLYFGVPEESCG
jgi:hypothetical protein